ncbi:MAG: hypothetical protein WC188_04650 [Candidatus Caldatribacteriota bacterium]
MTQFYYPTQYHYNDPLYQKRTEYNTIYREKYLSKAFNDILKMFGDNIIMKGLEVTPSYGGSIINLVISSGYVIHDSTFIQLINSSTLSCDVLAVDDTPTTNAHLAIFTDFQYVESPDVDTQTELKLSVYHVSSLGVVTAFSGSPAFSTLRNKILVSILEFTKVGAFVTACNETLTDLAGGDAQTLLVNGTNYYLRGFSKSNINCYNIVDTQFNIFLSEFLFHDKIC